MRLLCAIGVIVHAWLDGRHYKAYMRHQRRSENLFRAALNEQLPQAAGQILLCSLVGLAICLVWIAATWGSA